MWGEGVLATEFDAFGLGVGPTARGALGDAAAFEFRGNAKHGKDKLGKIARGIKHRLGQRTQASPGAFAIQGSMIPFAQTEAERLRADDPRPSLEARYASRDAWSARLAEAVDDAYVSAPKGVVQALGSSL